MSRTVPSSASPVLFKTWLPGMQAAANAGLASAVSTRMGKVNQKTGTPTPTPPFFPPEQTPLRGSHSPHLCYLQNKGQNVFFFFFLRAFPMLLCFTRLAWCLLLSLICKCPRVLQGNPEHTCCRQRFYSLFVYRPLVARIVKVTVLSE